MLDGASGRERPGLGDSSAQTALYEVLLYFLLIPLTHPSSLGFPFNVSVLLVPISPTPSSCFYPQFLFITVIDALVPAFSLPTRIS